jgi:hypothetical protein
LQLVFVLIQDARESVMMSVVYRKSSLLFLLAKESIAKEGRNQSSLLLLLSSTGAREVTPTTVFF